MQLRNSAQVYGAIPKSLHWLTVALVIVAWVLGTFGDELPRGAARDFGMFVHITAGLLIIALLVARVLWRVLDPPPPAETTPFGSWIEAVGKLTHLTLYVLLAVTPIMGIVLQFARGDALPVFGFTEIASPWIRDKGFARSMKDIHETLANALVILAVLHACAALIHHWAWQDRTLKRMLPGIAR
jgi:cytochrome b561